MLLGSVPLRGRRLPSLLMVGVVVPTRRFHHEVSGEPGSGASFADVEADHVRIADLIRADYVQVRESFTRYADLKFGFVDAAVVAIVERLNEHKLATLDHRHFTTIRPDHPDTIELLSH